MAYAPPVTRESQVGPDTDRQGLTCCLPGDSTQQPKGMKGGPAHSTCCITTHVLIDLEDDWRRVEIHLVLVHQHREAPDLLSHRSRHLQKEARC